MFYDHREDKSYGRVQRVFAYLHYPNLSAAEVSHTRACVCTMSEVFPDISCGHRQKSELRCVFLLTARQNCVDSVQEHAGVVRMPFLPVVDSQKVGQPGLLTLVVPNCSVSLLDTQFA
jgi:hypothetical protein